MKRILLTAAGFENKKIESIFLKMLGKDPQQAKALWIPTASYFFIEISISFSQS